MPKDVLNTFKIKVLNWQKTADIHIMIKRLMSRNTCFMWKVKVLVTQLCPILCDPKDNTPPGSSAHGILQARILEWVAIPFSRGSSWSRDWTWLFCIAGRFFTIWAAREAQVLDRYTYFHVYALSCIFHIVFRLLFACPQIFFSW